MISDVVISTVHVQTLLKMLISAYPTWCDRRSRAFASLTMFAAAGLCLLNGRLRFVGPSSCHGLACSMGLEGKLDMLARCGIFLGLLLGCSELPDGATVLRAFPAWNCDEIENRELIGWFGTLLLCVGLPLVCTLLAALHLKRKFKSALSYFLVRSVFSGYNDSATGFGFKVFCMGRIFFLGFVVTSPAWIGDTSQLIGLQCLITTTLFVEGLTQPRTTTLMNMLESVEEMVLFAFVEIGFSATGSEERLRSSGMPSRVVRHL